MRTDEERCVTPNSANGDSGDPDSPIQSTVERLLTPLSDDRFRDWYRERQYRQNIENGTPFFNGPSPVSDPERHSPSRLLKCHRKVVYQQCNAPEESNDPEGIFWFGTRFEEDIAFPFLRDAVTDSETYVQNSVWVDFRVETEGVELQIRGETDPLIVDADAVPILPTEIKTKSSVDHTTEPNRSHRAQLHAYMAGLSKKFDINLTDGVVLYGSRETMDVKIFHIKFDTEFWDKVVLKWAAEHTNYRLSERLPPAEPESNWECKFCAYSERCGQGEKMHKDTGSKGLLPLYTDYPRQKVIKYMEARSNVKLSPTIGHVYPDLVTEYGVYDWVCQTCERSYDWDKIEWNAAASTPPSCPVCEENGDRSWLRGPNPADQVEGRIHE